MEKRETRGGARKGAGRKPRAATSAKSRAVSIYLSSDIAAIIKPMRDKSRLIEQLLRNHFCDKL